MIGGASRRLGLGVKGMTECLPSCYWKTTGVSGAWSHALLPSRIFSGLTQTAAKPGLSQSDSEGGHNTTGLRPSGLSSRAAPSDRNGIGDTCLTLRFPVATLIKAQANGGEGGIRGTIRMAQWPQTSSTWLWPPQRPPSWTAQPSTLPPGLSADCRKRLCPELGFPQL